MRRVNYLFALPLAVAVIGLAASCGSLTGKEPSSANATGNAIEKDRVTPPKDYYSTLMQNELDSVHVAGDQNTQTLFVDFEGGVVEKGFAIGQSFLACADKITIPAAVVSDTDRTEILRQVQAYFAQAKATLRVVSARPASGSFTTIMVGGSPADLLCKGLSGLAGIAPFDIGNVNLNDIAFVFNSGKEDIATLAKTIAHEAGHTFGLDHVDNPKSIMNPVITDLVQGFLSGTVIGGSGVEDAVAVLQKILGVIGQTPVVPNGVVVPVPGSSLFDQIARMMESVGVDPKLTSLLSTVMTEVDKAIPGGISSMPGMDKVMAVLNVLTTHFDPNNTSTLTPANAVASVMEIVQIITGKPVEQTPWVTALTNILEKVDMNVVLGSLTDVFKSSNTNGGQIINIQDIQDPTQLTGMLGLTAAKTPAAQLAALRTQKAYIWNAYTGETRTALLSFLKAGHMGAWARFK